MGVAALVFNEEEAIRGLKSWVDLVLASLYDAKQIRRGRRNAPASSQRQVTILPLKQVSDRYGFTNMRSDDAQRNLVQVGIDLASAGNYEIEVLGQSAAFVAGGGDDAEAIRDGLRDAVSALGLAVTVADVGADAFTVQGNVAGVWLGLSVLDEPAEDSIGLAVIDDTARVTSSNIGEWPVRITIDDVISSAAGARSKIGAAANLVMETLKTPGVPVVQGSAVSYAGDLLAAQGLAFLDVIGTASLDYSTGAAGATVWHQRCAIDVVFNTTTGLAFDQPTIESLGPVEVTISDP